MIVIMDAGAVDRRLRVTRRLAWGEIILVFALLLGGFTYMGLTQEPELVSPREKAATVTGVQAFRLPEGVYVTWTPTSGQPVVARGDLPEPWPAHAEAPAAACLDPAPPTSGVPVTYQVTAHELYDHGSDASAAATAVPATPEKARELRQLTRKYYIKSCADPGVTVRPIPDTQGEL